MMKKALKVAKWEYLERIKNKSYIFMTFLFPIFVFGIALIPSLFLNEEDTVTKVFGVIEINVSLVDEVEKSLSEYKTKDGQPAFIIRKLNSVGYDQKKSVEEANKLVLEKAIEGFLFIEKVSADSFLIEYHTEKAAAIRDISRLEKAVNKSLINEKLKVVNLDPDLIKKLTKATEIKVVKITEKEKEHLDTEKVFLGTFMFIMFLMLSLISSAGIFVRSVVEEKSNRIIEILISSCSTKDLMAGKILGLSALGLTQVLVWILVAISIGGPVILKYVEVQDFGFSMIYFILGYIFYASLFIGIGSIGNTEQESQSIMSILSIIILLPIFFAVPILENPESELGVILSYFPLTTAPMMTMRVNITDIILLEKIVTLIILLISIYGSIWFSSKIFRVAILSYGKVPNISEIINWLRSK